MPALLQGDVLARGQGGPAGDGWREGSEGSSRFGAVRCVVKFPLFICRPSAHPDHSGLARCSGIRTDSGLAVTIVELPLHSAAPPIPMTSRWCWENPSHGTDVKDSSSSNCLHRMSVSVVHGPVSTVTRPGFPAPLLLPARGHGVRPSTSVCRWLPRQSAYL
jgi:hypothetical protein